MNKSTSLTPPPSSSLDTQEHIDRAGSPMMKQFWEIKQAYPDCLLFFRMGDFYELFFDDAVTAAGCLDIVLTKRGRHLDQDIPMCGVPFHAYEAYLQKLIREGHRVAICEQIEDVAEAKKRAGRPLVKRGVVRLVTPGTLTEDSLLEGRSSNYLLALFRARGELGLAWADISTGYFNVTSAPVGALSAQLARLDPSEILIPDALFSDEDFTKICAEFGNRLHPRPRRVYDPKSGNNQLKELFGVATIDVFGRFSSTELAAVSALLEYISLTQVKTRVCLQPPKREESNSKMVIDGATRRSLELTRCQNGEKSGSLLSAIQETVTNCGARLLEDYIRSPLICVKDIIARQEVVEFFFNTHDLRHSVRALLRKTPDMERALTRLSLNRGGPRDLAAIRDALGQVTQIKQELLPYIASCPQLLEGIFNDFGSFASFEQTLTAALSDNLPLLTRDGDFIRPRFHAGLDELRTLRNESRRFIAQLEAKYRNETSINNLKIKHNNILGYFVEVTLTHSDRLMDNNLFIHRQTMVNQGRFSTIELNDIAQKINNAAHQSVALELEIFNDLLGQIQTMKTELALVAAALARLDVASSLGELAVKHKYCRPIVDESTAFKIVGGRHPVIEKGGSSFISNDCVLEESRKIWLLTGPNMAGKSTFLRQNALITILAHIGSFVPAESAYIGVVDKIFSRVGASDDLVRGRSTFMMEMVETATILNQARKRSLVILDEVGRGTSTFDGVSIAWATLEYLHNHIQCRGLFATHYHELTALSAQLHHVACYTLAVREWEEKIIFLYNVIAGSADRSYGIHVARLAGVPEKVLHRAQKILDLFEQDKAGNISTKLMSDLPLFKGIEEENTNVPSITSPPAQEDTRHPVLERLEALNIDALSPRDAIDVLYELKEHLE